VSLGVLLLTLVACLVRAGGLPAVQGTMGRDEARLALAGQAILQHGVPVLSDGFVYTRGLLPAYLNAASFLVLGSSDQAARLSDLVFASLLVPAVYRLGRLAGGHRPAIAAAIVVAFSPPLVLQAREAWLYSTFLFWLVMALGWLVRDGPGDRPRAALAALAALFSHELAVLFVPVALLLDLGRYWHRRRRSSWERGHPGRPGTCRPPRKRSIRLATDAA
jgi:4-amino-4-deoxy-L-arabinose transferase-like glycosyltransferase